MRALQYLKKQIGETAGQSAMIALALMKAEVPHNDPTVQSCMSPVRKRFGTGGEYSPRWAMAPALTRLRASIMALATEDPEANRGLIATDRQLHCQPSERATARGITSGRSAGDTSISQYAVLGLWEAENDRRRHSAGGLGPRPHRGTCRCRARPEAGTTTAMRRVSPKPAR